MRKCCARAARRGRLPHTPYKTQHFPGCFRTSSYFPGVFFWISSYFLSCLCSAPREQRCVLRQEDVLRRLVPQVLHGEPCARGSVDRVAARWHPHGRSCSHKPASQCARLQTPDSYVVTLKGLLYVWQVAGGGGDSTYVSALVLTHAWPDWTEWRLLTAGPELRTGLMPGWSSSGGTM